MVLPTVSFDQFLQMLGSSTVSSVIFQPDDMLEVVTNTAQRLTTRAIRGLSTEWIVQRLLETRTPFSEGRKSPSSLARSLRGMLVLLFPALYLYMAYEMMKRLTDDQSSSLVEQRKKRRPRTSANVSWGHIAGIDTARRELQEVVDFMLNPEKFRKIGARCPRGVLLSGPPGCGKTLLARAAAAEAGVNIIVCSASDFVEVFVGRGAARIRDLFQRADACAPCILFFDELDALAKSRTGGGFGNDEREQTLNQLLTEMDGFDSSMWGGEASSTGSGKAEGAERESKGAVVVIAATNRPDVLDTALVRPGRFDRHVRVSLPDEAGRLEILLLHTRLHKVPMEDGAPFAEIAHATPGFSGAELGNVVNEASLLAVRADREIVSAEDFRAATKKVWEMKPVPTVQRFLS